MHNGVITIKTTDVKSLHKYHILKNNYIHFRTPIFFLSLVEEGCTIVFTNYMIPHFLVPALVPTSPYEYIVYTLGK